MNTEAPGRTYPDHREGIAGRQLDPNGLLSLDEHARGAREALTTVWRHLYSACLVGNPAPIVAEMYAWMKRVKPGDLVIEWAMGTSPRVDPNLRLMALGYLIEHRDEWAESEADWKAFAVEDPASATEDNRATDHAWYIQYGPDPADVCRWTNCNFMRVPVEPGDVREWTP